MLVRRTRKNPSRPKRPNRLSSTSQYVDYRTTLAKEAVRILGARYRGKKSLGQLLEILRNSKPHFIASATDREIVKIVDEIITSIKEDKGKRRTSRLLAELDDKVSFALNWD